MLGGGTNKVKGAGGEGVEEQGRQGILDSAWRRGVQPWADPEGLRIDYEPLWTSDFLPVTQEDASCPLLSPGADRGLEKD